MKFKLFILFITYSVFSYSQCFDCGHSIGGHNEDHITDIDKATDGIILTYINQSSISTITKYDFNCNLMWSNTSISAYGKFFRDITLDNNNNIYLIFSNYGGSYIINGITIENGASLIRLNSNGNIEWAKKFSDFSHLKSKVHFWNNNIYVIGQMEGELENANLGLTIPNGYGNQYFSAKYDLFGNLVNAEHYGENLNETYFDSQIDEDGNIYITGTLSSFSNHISNLLKINSTLDLLWSQELSNTPSNRPFKPMTLYYNETNQKLYVWSKYFVNANFYGNNIAVSNGCDTGSVIMEISKNSGDLENYKVIDNCGFLNSVGNGIGNVEQRSFMTHEGSNLYVLSSFRGEITIGNQTINTSQTIYDQYNTDLILYKINLTDFSDELILKSEGENTYPNYYDLAGPIVAVNNTVYITSSYTSKTITINGNTIVNNSGNNARDVLYYKHNLDQANPSGLITFENTCLSQTTKFSIGGDFDSVLWNFDDPSSGLDNTSTLTDPSHNYTSSGIYNVSALVTCGSETETIEVEVIISSSPTVNQINNLHSCEDSFGSQISSTFDTSSIENELIGNQSGLNIKYFNSNGIELPSPLPNPMTNSVLGQETITARVAYNNNLTCFTEISFDLIVNPLPEINEVNNIYACDDDYDGITEFDISNIESIISDNQSGMILEFFYENGQPLPNPLPNTIQNIVLNQETITARITDPNTNCYNESSFNLIVNPLPEANQLQIIYGCDDNNDGISEYFDTSNIESQVLNGQTDKSVSYFDQTGNELPNPLPNPYTNSAAFNELITVRVTDNNSTCYAETTLQLQTVTQPNINQPNNLYSCDQGNGYAEFNTSSIEQQLIGNQTGLSIQYYDSDNNPLPSPLPELFQNTEPFSQTINVRVEDASNPICFSETSFDLIVNELPEINLEDEYFICNLEPSILLNVNSGFNSYNWFFEDGTLISSTNNGEITEEGNYTLTVTQIENGITCENSFDFTLIRSVLPEIQQVNFGELGDNYIEIIASGDGDFEYSIDGINYQDSNYFLNIQGGLYTVFVRDKDGCGQDSEEVTIIDYPKFFTPNNDGYNDFWQIKGIINFPNSETLIFDRYGKLLARVTSNDLGWNGLYNGKQMMSNNYWFRTNLGNGRTFSGYFSLKR